MNSYQYVNSMSAATYGQRAQETPGLANTDFYGVGLNSYNNCYSPPLQQYGAYTPAGLAASDFVSSAAAAAAVTSPPSVGASVGSTGASGGSTTPGPAVQGRLHQPSSSPSATPVAATACKFEPNTSTSSSVGPVGSPQDLSVSAGGSGPGSSSSTSSEPNSSSQGGSGGGGAGGSASGGEGDGGEEASGSSSSSSKPPPQIYPWMKRVHLGQSE